MTCKGIFQKKIFNRSTAHEKILNSITQQENAK